MSAPTAAPTPAVPTGYKVSAPHDKSEREADRIANQVVQMTDPVQRPICACGGACPACRKDTNDARSIRLKRRQLPNTHKSPVSRNVNNISQSQGRSLDGNAKAFMESRFGHDLGHVRIFTGTRASESAKSMGALAYTVGSNVVFQEGQYQPQTASGRRLLAHEIAHVVQQDPPSNTIYRQLDPSMCSSDCATPDGSGGNVGKFSLTIYADKEGPFLLLWATHKVGHSWVKLTDDSGNYWTFGFWPQSGYDAGRLTDDVEGCVHHPDTSHKPTSSQTFELTAAEFAAAKAKAVSTCIGKPKYNLFGLQCTEFVRQILAAAGQSTSLGFGLVWESPNALDSWIRSNALMLGVNISASSSDTNQAAAGTVGLDLRYTHQFFSLLGNKLRLHWMSRGEWGQGMASLSTGAGIEATTQRVFLPSVYLFGGGIAGDLSPSRDGNLGAGLTGGAGLAYKIDELATVGVEYNLVKNLVTDDPALSRLMLSARLKLW